jgi:hypothetical protein
VITTGRQLGIRVSENFPDLIEKEWYRYYDPKDSMVISFFRNRGFWKRAKKCLHCGQGEGTRDHMVDECLWYDTWREELLGNISSRTGRSGYGVKLSDMMDILCFEPSDDSRTRRVSMEMLKSGIAEVYFFQNKELYNDKICLNNPTTGDDR